MQHQEKPQLRQIFLRRRQALSSSRQQHAAQQFAAFVSTLPTSALILSYISFRSELSSQLANLQLLANTHRVIVPLIAETKKFSPLQISSATCLSMIRHPLNISPTYGQIISAKHISYALVPALAFDQHHFRLGYGGGYYDRWLSENPHIHTIGVGFHEQLTDQLPRESQDIPVHEVMLF